MSRGWALAVISLSLPASVIHADPLPAATWAETISLHIPNLTSNYTGQDPAAPEVLSKTTTSAGNSLTGDVTFGAAGPPFATTHAKGSVPNGGDFLNPLTYSVLSQTVIAFDARIVETHLPPVAVSTVPILIGSLGSLHATGNAIASGSMIVHENGIEIFNKTASVTYSVQQASLGASDARSLPPGTILHGDVIVTAQMSAAMSASGEATASLGPSFEVTSAFIPGTEYQYADFFKIEYSPGYWALGDPTPVGPISWGRIKTLYRAP